MKQVMSVLSKHPLFPGLGLVAVLVVPAWWLGGVFPLVGSAVIGMLLGMAVRQVMALGERHHPGIRFAGRQLLQYSIVALGFSLPIREVAHTGLHSLPVSLVTLSVAFATAIFIGRALRVPGKLNVLIGAGTAICGGSAIAAIIPVLQPDDHDTTYALSTIFLFNIVAVLTFPLLGHLMHMTDSGFGLWAGTAINDTSSVVAAGYAWSRNAGEYATIVKLTRAMMIVPVTLVIGLLYHRQRSGSSIRRTVPGFIVLFVLASVFNGFMPAEVTSIIRKIAPWLITGALTAIGLSTDLRRLRSAGARPLLLGLLVWASVACSSLLMQHFTGAL
jgi:uncharacterized integral membrane protein (TIGR00698 family)